MKLIKFLSLSSLLVVFGSMNVPIYAETEPVTTHIAQSKNEDNSELLIEKATKTLKLFFDKNFEEVRKNIHPDLQNQVTVELLKQEWLSTNSQNGNFKKIQKSKALYTPGSDLVILTVEFEKVTDDWIVIFNDNQQIIGTDFPTSKNLEEIALEVVNSLANSKFDTARSYLHPFLKKDIFPEQVQSKWEQLQKENGNFQKIIGTNIRRGSSLDNADIVFVTIQFAKNTQDLLIMFNNNKRIIGVDFPQN